MYEAKIVTVMGFVGLGDQRPKMESHEGQKFSLGPSYQRTAQIVQNIRSGDVIVILRNSLDHFMDLVESESTLAQDFVLVSVNTDDPVTAQHRDRVSKFAPIRAFFGQNMQIGLGNHKIFPLPLGLPWHTSSYPIIGTNGQIGALVEQQTIFDIRSKLVVGNITKKPKILWCGERGSNRPKREEFIKALLSAPGFDGLEECTAPIPPNQYMEVLAMYAFVLSPPGVGYDCYRHWQALAVGTVPIIWRDNEYDNRLFDDTKSWLVNTPNEVVLDFDNKLQWALQPLQSATLPNPLSLKHWDQHFRSFM